MLRISLERIAKKSSMHLYGVLGLVKRFLDSDDLDGSAGVVGRAFADDELKYPIDNIN